MKQTRSLEQLQQHLNRSQFHQLFKPEVLAVDNDQLKLTIKVKQSSELERQPDTDQWHGGAIAALVDIAGSYALMMISPEPLPTINFRTDYLRPAFNTSLTAQAQIRQAGRSIGVVDIDINNDQGKLVAVGRGTYSMTTFSSSTQNGSTASTGNAE